MAIAVDPPERSRKLREALGLPFPLLCDPRHEVVERYGLLHRGAGIEAPDIAVPAHALVGRDGRILWRFVANRISDRPDPQDVQAALRAHGE